MSVKNEQNQALFRIDSLNLDWVRRMGLYRVFAGI